jgi:hypothetical protein
MRGHVTRDGSIINPGRALRRNNQGIYIQIEKEEYLPQEEENRNRTGSIPKKSCVKTMRVNSWGRQSGIVYIGKNREIIHRYTGITTLNLRVANVNQDINVNLIRNSFLSLITLSL